MKDCLLILLFAAGTHRMIYAQYHGDDAKTTIVNMVDAGELDNLVLNFCDTFSMEFTGLYPISDSLPPLMQDNTMIKKLLLEKGFSNVDWGSGNWEKGPRFIYLKFTKDGCNCNTFKKYYYNVKQREGYYNLRITERIICNTDKFMDD